MSSHTWLTSPLKKPPWLPLMLIAVVGGLCIFQVRLTPTNGALQAKTTVPQTQQPVAVPLPSVVAVVEAPKKLIMAPGRVVALSEIEIKSKINGVVRNVAVEIGDTVKRGKLLVELDPADALIQVHRAEASLAASELRCDQARENLMIAQMNVNAQSARAESYIKSASARAERTRRRADRIKDALKKSAASQEDSDEAETWALEAAANLEVNKVQLDDVKTQKMTLEVRRQDVACAEAQVTLDGIALQDAQQRLADTKIFAPMSGVVTARSIQPGQFVAVGTNTGESALLTISDLSRRCVLARVLVGQIAKIEVGEPVAIHANAISDTVFQGRVTSIAPCGTSNGADVTVGVKIEVLSDGVLPLRPEVQVSVEFISKVER